MVKNEVQRQIHMLRKTLNRIKVLMRKESNQDNWFKLASKHGELTIVLMEMREELNRCSDS